MSTTNSGNAESRSPQSMTEDSQGPSNPSKRQRSSKACGRCRSRKQACNGSTPCDRCVEEDKVCYYLEPRKRTPRTRLRIDELEERIACYDRIWGALYPGVLFDSVCDDVLAFGVDLAVARLRSAHPGTDHETIAATQGSFGTIPPLETAYEDQNHFSVTPPATEPVSSWTAQTPVPQSQAPDDDAPSHEWREVPGLDAPAGAGMGTFIQGNGASYLGLSSGSAVLQAITKLVPRPLQCARLLPNPNRSSSSYSTSTRTAPLNSLPGMAITSSGAPGESLNEGLPHLSQVRPLVDAYFRYFHPIAPIVHEPTFRAQMAGVVALPSTPGNEVLVNMVFAMGALDSSTTDDDRGGDQYYLKARSALQRDMFEGGTISLVQGLGIMANYLQRSDRPNAGYMCLGWALRMAMALGLHEPVSSRHCSPFEKEMKTRVWWGLVILESGCSVTFGRPHPAGDSQLNASPLPINCSDDDLTVLSTRSPTPQAQITSYTSLIYQSRLARVTWDIHERVLCSNPAPTVEQLLRYDERIRRAIDDFPSYMRDSSPGPYHLARAVQTWRTSYFRSILFRPLLVGAALGSGRHKAMTSAVTQGVQICRSLALENLEDIAGFVHASSDHMRGTEWYTVYFALQACLTLMLSLVWEPTHELSALWRESILATATWFRQLCQMYANLFEEIAMSSVNHGSGNLMPTSSTDNVVAWIDPNQGNALAADQPPAAEGIFDVDQFMQELFGGAMPAGLTLEGGDGGNGGGAMDLTDLIQQFPT